MRVFGIICEYNPFHRGHKWQIDELRRLAGEEECAAVCAMSGDFVQRGDFAIERAHARAEAAVRGGADLVLELPLPWAISSAEGFARGGVSILAATGVVDTLVFGSECGNAAKLQRAAKALLRETQRLGVTVNRIDETLGAFRHTRAELLEYAALCRDSGAALTVSIGPRAAYDTSATRLSRQGAVIGYRLRGEEQLVRALEDAKRVCDLGIRGLLVYDEGLLWVLSEARKTGELPADTVLKASAHCGHGNGASFRLLEQCGADSINPVRDLSLDMLCALRASVSVPLDVHTDCPEGSGGFIRTYEAPEIVRCCAPVYLKIGNSALTAHGSLPTEADAARMAQQAAIVMEMLERYLPEARQLARGEGRGLVAEAEVRV